MITSTASEQQPAVCTGDDTQVCITLERIGLCFRKYGNALPSLKQTVLNSLFRRKYAKTEEFWLFKNVDLQIASGQRVGIIGANGAGKSTLLKIIAGIYHPTEGALRVRGRIAPLIELGAGINPELSGRENIYLMGALLGFSPQVMEDKVEAILDFSGVREFADTPMKYYSTGMLMRLVFSIATDVNPEILLIDEVFSAGDAEFVVKAMKRMEQLMQTSEIVILVSHDLGLVQRFSNRVIWVDKGTVKMDGDPAEVIEAYTRFEADKS